MAECATGDRGVRDCEGKPPAGGVRFAASRDCDLTRAVGDLLPGGVEPATCKFRDVTIFRASWV